MDVHVEIIREAGPELVDAFSRLLPQLSSTAEPSTTRRSTAW
ncbi:hypothetical protein ABT147_01480 [Streptomyces sp. NPDC001868]